MRSKVAEAKAREASKLADAKARAVQAAAKDGSILASVQGAAVGAAAGAAGAAKGVQAAYAEGASERTKVKFVGKAPAAEAKPLLEEAMAAYTVSPNPSPPHQSSSCCSYCPSSSSGSCCAADWFVGIVT